ncbi:hypothetical protein D3C73_1238930 [compost metagenome]
MEYVPCQAFGMHTYQHWLFAVDITLYQSNMLLGIYIIGIGNRSKFAIIRWHAYLDLAMHKLFFFIPVMDQILNRNQLKIMCFGNFRKIRQSCHSTVFLNDFTDYTSRICSAHTSQINRCFSVACTSQNAAPFSYQWKHMSRTTEVTRFGRRVHNPANG